MYKFYLSLSIITHSLASAKKADRIIVMEEGKIIQEGSNNTLINIEGNYKEMYETQAKYYQTASIG